MEKKQKNYAIIRKKKVFAILIIINQKKKHLKEAL
jgi:hypothetical protein